MGIQKGLDDTIVALATPQGVGAIGVIRVSGSRAIALVGEFFKGKNLEEVPSHTVHFGRLVDQEGVTVDEVLVSVFRNPSSYTGEDSVEISCHGSSYILETVLMILISGGARLAGPGEFTMRAFLNGKLDLTQAEAVADLIASENATSHRMAMDQMRGGISKKIGGLRQQLLDFASLIELELDFSEEDVEFADRGQLKELLLTILKLVEELMASFKMGNVLKKGINTVIAGRPNAGKSTLLNALLEEERAIVSPIAGTTRDTIEEVLQIEGIPFRIIDTAGIREAEDAIEQIGVERTMEKVRQSAVVIYVFDVIATQPELVREDIKALQQEGIPMLVVANKMDLNPYTLPEHYLGPEEKGVVWVALSALNGMNIGHLKEELVAQVTSGKGIMDTTLLSNARHLEALLSTRESLTAALRIMEEGISSDFMAIEIRHALNHLGEITGEVSTEDLLGNIFSNFCIGK